MIKVTIKAIRKQKSMTQEELANKSNLSQSYISEIENNKTSPTLDCLESIASALDVCAIDLLDCSCKNSVH